MANDLKKVGLVFKADGSVDFQKSLTAINTSLQNNRNELKLTKMTYDENTKASKKLKDTQSYLSKQYEESTAKVELLTAQLEEMKNSENANELAIQKKQKQLNTAKVAQESYRKGLKEVSDTLKKGTADIEQYAKKLKETGNNVSSVGKGLTKGLTVPIAAVGTAAMVAWNEIDKAYDNIVSGTGATGKALSDLHSVFDEVFGDLPVEAMDASTAVANLNTRFGFTNDKLASASKNFLKFAQVNKTDVGNAIALVSRAMGDAGIDSSEYSKVLDALTAASQASGVSIDSLTENLTKFGAPMRALGLDTEASIALFAQWEKAGVNTNIAFSGMKKAISNWGAAGKDSRVEFAKTLEEIKNCPDIASATTKAIEVFGAKAGPDLADAIQNGRFSVEEMTKVVQNSGGIVEQSFNDMQDPVGKAKVAMNNMKLVGADLADEMQGALAPVIESISELMKDFAEWFKNLDPNIKTIIVTVGALLLALGPVVIIIGNIISAFGVIMEFITPLIGAINAAGGILQILSGTLSGLLSPITAVVAFIALLAATFADLWNSSENFRNNVITMFNDISSILSNIYQTVLAPIFSMIGALLMDIWETALKPLWDNWKSFINSIVGLMKSIITAITPVINWFISVFGPVFVTVFAGIIAAIRSVIGNITNILSGLLKSCKTIIDGITSVFSGIIDFITGIFTGNWKKAWNGVIKIFKGIVSQIKGIFSIPINACIGIMNGLIDGLNLLIKGINKIKFDVPDWIPKIGGKTFGFDLPKIGKIPYMQFGGELLRGVSIVGEAGAEMLQQTNRGTRVIPLTDSGGTNKQEIIDYDKLAFVLLKSIKNIDWKIILNNRNVARAVSEL